MKIKPSLYLALWYAANFIALLSAGVYAFPKFEGSNVIYPSVIELFNLLRGMAPVPTPENPVIFFFAAALLLTVAFGGIAALFTKTLKWFSMEDVFKLTLDAMTWGIRNYIVSGIVILSVAIWIGIASAIYLENRNSYLAIPAELLCLILLLATPFVTLNKRFLSLHQVKDWHKPSWPGWQPLLFCAAIFAILRVIEITVADVSLKLLPANITVQVVWYLLDIFVSGLMLSILVYRTKWRDIGHELRMRTNIRFCMAWLLMNVRIFFIALWVAPLFLLALLVNIFVVPPYADVLNITGGKFGTLASTFIYLSNGFVDYWPLIALPLIVLIFMIYGRYLLLYDQLPLETPFPSNVQK